MVHISDKVFDEFEEKVKKSEAKKEISGGDLYEMLVRFSSSVVMSGFFGLDSMK